MRVSSSTARLAAALSALLPARALAIPGDATFTDGKLASGTCSFSNYSFPPGIYGSGLGPANWAGGAKCGACLQVTGPRGSTKVMIVDSCPSCSGSRLNLFSDAFKLIGDPSDGVIPINYDPISCGIAKPLRLRNKSGTSKWYLSLQVLDANYPITALDVSTDNGQSWKPTIRKEYNYFEREGSAGFEKDFVHVRISCSNGRQVIIPSVSAASEAKTEAPVNC
ncbi:hypothetical protein RB594_007000 [Gaeumannomyces avenae]